MLEAIVHAVWCAHAGSFRLPVVQEPGGMLPNVDNLPTLVCP